MRNLKTFEEYRYVNIGNKTYLGEPEAEKDPNEPFFNKAKKKYREKEQRRRTKQMFKNQDDYLDARFKQMQDWDDQEEDMAMGVAQMDINADRIERGERPIRLKRGKDEWVIEDDDE